MPQVDTHDGLRTIHSYYADDGSGEPLVLLHGGLESGDDWQRVAAELPHGCRVLRPDRRGHGRTADVEGPYSYPAMTHETILFVVRRRAGASGRLQ